MKGGLGAMWTHALLSSSLWNIRLFKITEVAWNKQLRSKVTLKHSDTPVSPASPALLRWFHAGLPHGAKLPAVVCRLVSLVVLVNGIFAFRNEIMKILLALLANGSSLNPFLPEPTSFVDFFSV